MSPRATALAALALAACSCSSLAGPEPRVASALAALPGQSFELADGCGAVRIDRAGFDHLLVKREGEAAVAVAQVDAAARWDGAAVSYLGLERIPFTRELVPAGAPLPGLGQLLAALCRRERAREKGDATAMEALLSASYDDPRESRSRALHRMDGAPANPRRRLAASIRVERDRAEVLETFAPAAEGGEKTSLRSTLVPESGWFRFASGLL